jgi:hypothetical protein
VETFICGGLLLTEETGLLFRKRWAEYLTIATTAGLAGAVRDCKALHRWVMGQFDSPQIRRVYSCA